MKHATNSPAPDYAKLAYLYRLAGTPPIVIFGGTSLECQNLYTAFQKWCNNTPDIWCEDNAIMCSNPVLAQTLAEHFELPKFSRLPSSGSVII